MSRERTMRKLALAAALFALFPACAHKVADLPTPVSPPAIVQNQAPAAAAILNNQAPAAVFAVEPVPAADNQTVFEGRIREVAVSSTPDYTNIEVEIDGKIGDYKSIKLIDPFRIMVDISGVDRGTAASEIPVGTPQVKTVRLFQIDNTLRMIVEPSGDRVEPFIVSLEGSRLVLSVGGTQAGTTTTATDNQAAAAGTGAAMGVGRKQATPPPRASGRPPVYLSMDFTDVDLPVLIKFISEQTKKNFIFDERVQGKITIISPRRISLDEAYNVFLSVLHVKGFATVDQGNTIKIVSMRDVRQEDLPTETDMVGMHDSRIIIRLIPLQYVDVADIVPLLTPLISKDGLLTSFPPSNTLIVIDSRANIDKVLRILGEIDQEGTGSTMRIFSLKNATVVEIAKTLDLVFEETGASQAPVRRGRAPRPGKARGSSPKFIPDTRTNLLIVLAGQEMMGDIGDLIARLDIPTPENTGKINVYYLENADAEEVAKVLASLTEQRPGTPQAPRQPATIKGVISAELEGGVKITADKATNSLIIIASLNDYQTLVDVIRKLDIRRRQVYVEALVMEIQLDKARDLGVEFRGAAETRNDGAVLGGSNFDFAGNLNELLVSLATGNPLLFSGTGFIAAGIAGNVVLPDGTEIPAITAVLRAAQTRDNVNVLSSPHLLTMDNKEAEIIIAENVPFITSQSRDTTNLANVINTVERKDVGIILRITPRINESDFVSLEIYQESSAVKGDSLLATSTVGPTTTKRSAKTSVLVKNGQTVVLGGMMQETANNIERKIPLLGDIPLLGNLFKFSSVTRKKTNMLIFLTPHVIKTPEEMGQRTTEHKRKMNDFIEQHRGEIEKILPDRNPMEGK
jgi:general secretion pathway protein D